LVVVAPAGNYGEVNVDGRDAMSGANESAGVVAGVVALMLEANPSPGQRRAFLHGNVCKGPARSSAIQL
jgi:hypothetical protein